MYVLYHMDIIDLSERNILYQQGFRSINIVAKQEVKPDPQHEFPRPKEIDEYIKDSEVDEYPIE